jgi:hypothetical protein
MGSSQQEAFDKLKLTLTTAPVLQVPDFSKEFVLVCDSSDAAISAVLHQKLKDDLAPIVLVADCYHQPNGGTLFMKRRLLP